MGKVSAFLNRKVFGIKVLYLLAVAVVGLGIAAYVIKPKTDSADEVSDVDETTTDDEAAESGTEVSDAEYLYPDAPTGTVTVSPAPVELNGGENESIVDNASWLSRGVAFLVGNGLSGTVAQSALQTYLSGGSLSVSQKSYVDKVIAEYGLPPDGTDSPAAKTVKTRAVSRYVRPSNGADYFIVYSDKTLRKTTVRELKALNKYDKVQTLPLSDPVWSYPVYDTSGRLVANYNPATNASRITAWFRVKGTDTFYAKRADGTVSKTSKASWTSYGSPSYTTVSANDSRIKGK